MKHKHSEGREGEEERAERRRKGCDGRTERIKTKERAKKDEEKDADIRNQQRREEEVRKETLQVWRFKRKSQNTFQRKTASIKI